MNFIYNRDNAGRYPLDDTSVVWVSNGWELHREVTYKPDDIIRHWYIVNPQNAVAILNGYEYDEVTQSHFEELIHECHETLSV